MVEFSIIIPTFNRAHCLPKLLDSLVKQTYKRFEVIISDDGSTDETEVIVRNYSSKLKIKYLQSSNWGGPARPRNLGLALADFEWICFLDSDDTWYPQKLEMCSDVITSYKHVEVIIHKFAQFDENGRFVKVIGKYTPQKNNFKNLINTGNKIVLSSLVVKKKLIERVGGFNEDRDLIGIEDYDLVLKLALHESNFKLIDIVLGEYQIGRDSISQSEIRQLQKVKKLMVQFKKHNENFLTENRIKSIEYYMLGNFYQKDIDFKKSTFFFKKALLLNPFSQIGFKSLLKSLINVFRLGILKTIPKIF